MAKRRRSRKRSYKPYYFDGLGADEMVVEEAAPAPKKETDWFWPVAILLGAGALIYMIKNIQTGTVTDTQVTTGGGGGSGGSGNGASQALPPGSGASAPGDYGSPAIAPALDAYA